MEERLGIKFIMNKLPLSKRTQILHMLVEGMSMRAVARIADVSRNTVDKLLRDVGAAALAYQDATLRNLPCKRVECDEIWSFTYAKARNVEAAVAAPEGAGDTWTWTAICADTKLVPCWHVGGRDAGHAAEFMEDLAGRLVSRVQLTTDGHRPYLEAVDYAFGGDIDYAMLVKIYGPFSEGQRRYSPAQCLGADIRPITGNRILRTSQHPMLSARTSP